MKPGFYPPCLTNTGLPLVIMGRTGSVNRFGPEDIGIDFVFPCGNRSGNGQVSGDIDNCPHHIQRTVKGQQKANNDGGLFGIDADHIQNRSQKKQ